MNHTPSALHLVRPLDNVLSCVDGCHGNRTVRSSQWILGGGGVKCQLDAGFGNLRLELIGSRQSFYVTGNVDVSGWL